MWRASLISRTAMYEAEAAAARWRAVRMAYSQLLESNMRLFGCRCPKCRASYTAVQAVDPVSHFIHARSTRRSNRPFGEGGNSRPDLSYSSGRPSHSRPTSPMLRRPAHLAFVLLALLAGCRQPAQSQQIPEGAPPPQRVEP